MKGDTGMDFFLKNLKETLEAINKLMDNNITIVNTKRIRRCNNIKASNRSKINFIWRSLQYLEKEEILRKNGNTNPTTYKVNSLDKIDIHKVILQAKRER